MFSIVIFFQFDPTKMDRVELAFRKFDLNQDGYLSREEFDQVRYHIIYFYTTYLDSIQIWWLLCTNLYGRRNKAIDFSNSLSRAYLVTISKGPIQLINRAGLFGKISLYMWKVACY